MRFPLLPAEAMAEILIAGLQPYDQLTDPWATTTDKSRQEYLMGICLVCRYWTELAYSVPSLWTLVVIPRPPRHSSRIRTQLERAKNARLNVVCFRLPRKDDGNSDTRLLWEQVKNRSSRWRTLALSGPDERVTEMYITETLGPLLPEVEALTFGGFRLVASTGISHPIFTAPVLREYFQDDSLFDHREPLTFFPFTPTPSIRLMQLRIWNNSICNNLPQFHGLRTLVFKRVGWITETPLKPVEIPSLRHLELIDCSSSLLSFFLTHLMTNNIESLSFTSLHFHPDFLSDPSPIFLPSLSAIYARNSSFRALERLLQSLKQASSLKVEIDLGSYMLTRDSTREHFESWDSTLRPIEALCSVRWVISGVIGEASFKSCEETREHFKEGAIEEASADL